MKIGKKLLLLMVMLGVSSVGLQAKPLMYQVQRYDQLKTMPGLSFSAPSGMVPGKGVAFGALSSTVQKDVVDGSLAVGMGFGNPFKGLGGAVSLALGSINPTDGGMFNRGNLSVSLGHFYRKELTGVSVGLSGIDLWHDKSEYKINPSVYAAATKIFTNFKKPVVASLGLGTNSLVDIDERTNRTDKIDFFASSAVYLMPQMSVILDYTAGLTTLATSFVPFPDHKYSFTAGVNGFFKEYNDESLKIFVNASYAFSYN